MLLFLALTTSVFAADDGIALSLTVVDLPYNTVGVYRPLSMQTSLDVGFDLTRLGTYGVASAFGQVKSPGLRAALGLPTLAIANIPMQMVLGWTHEEWHRSVMASQGVSSTNTIYNPGSWSGAVVSVNNVSDSDLASLKATQPADTVRLMSAGLESSLVLAERMGDAAFFEGGGRTRGPLYLSETWLGMTMAFQRLNVLGYYTLCASSEVDTLTEEMSNLDRVPLERDFTGADCTAWIYDMDRADQPFDARGPHPTGPGVDRYVSRLDLTDDEVQFLKLQTKLSLLNLVDPHLLLIDGFVGPAGSRWVSSLGYLPNPFGYTLSVHTNVSTSRFNVQTKLLAHVRRGGGVLPGVEAAWIDHPLTERVQATVGVGLWLQPKDLLVTADRNVPGGHGRLDLTWKSSDTTALLMGVEAKTAGFVPGNVWLGPNISVRAGVQTTIGKGRESRISK